MKRGKSVKQKPEDTEESETPKPMETRRCSARLAKMHEEAKNKPAENSSHEKTKKRAPSPRKTKSQASEDKPKPSSSDSEKTETRRCSARLAKLQEEAEPKAKPKPSPAVRKPQKTKAPAEDEPKIAAEDVVEKPSRPPRARRVRTDPSQPIPYDEDPHDLTLKECLETLNISSNVIGLPGREKEIAEIQDFINQCLVEPRWRVLLISGSPGTGKTATVKYCMEMSLRPGDISFVNCKTDTVKLISDEEAAWSKLLVIDEIESLPNFADVLLNCKNHGCSIIGISNAHDRTLAQANSGRSDTKTMFFNCYTPIQLESIMWERVGGMTPAIQREAVVYIAKSLGKERGDAREMLTCLHHVISEAVQKGLEKLDLKTTIAFIQNKATQKSSTGMEEVGLIDQLALAAIVNDGKKWKETFRRYSKAKHMDINCMPEDVFDRLVSYGFIKDNKKNPVCLMDRETLKNKLDSSISVLL